MFIQDIEAMGFTEKEAKLYITSLRIGPATMQVLARKAKIDRGTAYHVAYTLGQKGLFGTVKEGKRPLFGVTHPRELHQYVEEKKQEADRHFAAVQAVYEDLQALYALNAQNENEG